MHDLLLDIRFALRALWNSPAFTLVALVTLMLGIGANVVVFGVVNRSGGHSSHASAWRRSLQTLAGRVNQVNALHVSDHRRRFR